jgi:hypothetical protein
MGVILGISGPAGAGKDTVADFLVEWQGWDGKLSFAKNLKDMCKAIFYLSDYDVNDQEGKMRPFNRPVEFTDRNLGSVMFWMARTHASHPVREGAKEKVKAFVGKQLTNPRHILQFVGTDLCRELVPTYHVDILTQKIKDNPDGRFIITDVRFPNEGNLILDDLNGLVVYLDRLNSVAGNIDKTHPSETAMRAWGRFTDTISNHREGLNFLYEEVNLFLRKHNLCQTTQ